MNPFEEEDHIRILLEPGSSMMTHEQRIGLIAKIRKNAIAAIVKIRPETVTEGHDLTLDYQAHHFILELRKETIPPELSAYLNLLEVCTRSLDGGRINVNAICSAYRKTDGYLISGAKSAKGYLNRRDTIQRTKFIQIVQQLKKNLHSQPTTLKKWLDLPELHPFSVGYPDGHTLRDWITDAGVTLKTGRPKKT